MITAIMRHLAYRRACMALEAHRQTNFDARVEFRKRSESARFGFIRSRMAHDLKAFDQ
jgi:hypothetical protein